MKKIIYKIFILVLAVILTVVGILIISPTYQNHILASLNDKHKYLSESNRKRIIIVGGSSALFGIDSKLIEKEFKDYDVVNMGLHAGLGLEFMLNDIKKDIREGDIIIINSEYSHFYGKTNGEAVLNNVIVYNEFKNFSSLSIENIKVMLNGLPEFLRGQLAGIILGESSGDKNIMKRNNISEDGDIKDFDNKKFNITSSKNGMGKYDYKNIEIINKFNKFAEGKGAKVYLTLAPLLDDQYSYWKEYISEIIEKIEENSQVRLISNVDQVIFEEKYMYDSVYHLNYEGRKLRTERLIKDLKTNIFN